MKEHDRLCIVDKNVLFFLFFSFLFFFFFFQKSIVCGELIFHNLGHKVLNPFTPTSDQDRISPYNINTISISINENREEYQLWDY